MRRHVSGRMPFFLECTPYSVYFWETVLQFLRRNDFWSPHLSRGSERVTAGTMCCTGSGVRSFTRNIPQRKTIENGCFSLLFVQRIPLNCEHLFPLYRNARDHVECAGLQIACFSRWASLGGRTQRSRGSDSGNCCAMHHQASSERFQMPMFECSIPKNE